VKDADAKITDTKRLTNEQQRTFQSTKYAKTP